MDYSIRPRLFVPFERSGRVRAAFAKRGWLAVSCDLEPTDAPCGPNEYHHVGDARDLLDPEWLFGVGWDAMIAFPPCTYLSVSGLHWNGRVEGRKAKTEAAVELARLFIDHQNIPFVAVENPVGCLSKRIRKPDQIIQPHQFGDDASKATCLWLRGFPKLRPTKHIPPRIVDGKKRWANQTDGGQNKLGPSDDRAMIRALTYQGIADAMADQWTPPFAREASFSQPSLSL